MSKIEDQQLATIFDMGSSAISWRSKKYANMGLSSIEAKYRVAIMAAPEGNVDFRTNNFITGHLSSGIFDHLPKLRALSLTWNQISGRIPNSLFKCKELVYLSLHNNSLEGSLPIEIENLIMLNKLSLYRNNLEGFIPSSIFNLSSLQAISLGLNKLSSHLSPDMFDHLPRLLYLNMIGSQLSGRISTSLFKCKELEYLYLSSNQLVGNMPSEIGNFTWLKHLFLDQNKFEGSIPSSLFNISSLQVIELKFNKLSVGHLSSDIFDHLPNLRWLDLSGSQISRRIPTSLFKCKKLERTYLAYNQLEGTVPLEVANLTSLKVLDIDRNNLNGNLDQLQVLVLRSNRFYGLDNSKVTSSFTHLRVIDLSHNHFSGYLPTKFFENLHAIREGYEKKVKPEYMIDASADGIAYHIQSVSFTAKGLETEFQEILTTWTVIDFSNNQFMGQIPKAIGELHSLVVLNLSHNSLTGPIPPSLGDLSELESLDLSANKLEGEIPAQLKIFYF
ncbi:probable LRR receptor-like serine/threonine-protein kinase At1g34110 [Durio zibethinus]|uniref:Probable LRR receptor-like serine/threonine-protein kinase At1g34110 n=1 Tax=Durio zibethinus TaxID=66656 RepID=A0A6P5WNS7_DURZI|nr:probable LRR receptor-like serine/threonine-protein kinase At1g34110 [Durio zibethinus]